MRWKRRGAFHAGLGWALVACGTPAGHVGQGGLVGSWSWVEATGGIAGMTITPASAGQTIELRFDGARVDLVRDGELERTVTYEIVGRADGSSFELAYDGPLMGWDSQTADLSQQDVLMLTDPCCDGFTWRFLRVE